MTGFAPHAVEHAGEGRSIGGTLGAVHTIAALLAILQDSKCVSSRIEHKTCFELFPAQGSPYNVASYGPPVQRLTHGTACLDTPVMSQAGAECQHMEMSVY